MTEQLFLRQFSQMPEDVKREVLRFFEYLVFKHKLDQEQALPNTGLKSAHEPPKAGFMKGTFIVADDFDKPLEDFNDYQ